MPWREAEEFGNLRRGFEGFKRQATYATSDVVLFAAVASHYIQDAHQPFHATNNFNGQLTGNDGLHARFERCQHPVSPDGCFCPLPAGAEFSGLLSPLRPITVSLRHCHRLVLHPSFHSVSMACVAFAPPALPGFFATMDALTPVPAALRRVWLRD